MAPQFVVKLQTRAASIRERWESLLRVEPVNGPLANPDALVHLIPDSLRQIFAALVKSNKAPVSLHAAKIPLPACDCGHNPYLAYFVAGQQALAESLVL